MPKVRGDDAARVHLLEAANPLIQQVGVLTVTNCLPCLLLPPRRRLPDDTGSGQRVVGFAEAPAGSNGLRGR